jgi:hypothetical protein
VEWRAIGRWALGVLLLSFVALLVMAPGAFALAGTGKISGTVTEAVTKKGLPNMFVGVYEAHGNEMPVEFEFTGPNGEYTVEGLPEGEYKVQFSAGFEGQNFVTQFYKDQSSRADAEPVVVVKEKTTIGIDAEMQVGGEVEGTVTDAVTHKALPNAFVAALGPGEVEEGGAFTEAHGHYTIAGLATGSYKIGFEDPGYLVQYYNDQPLFTSANPVSVVQKSTTTGIDAALMPKAPINTAAPVASGTPAVGQTLSCSNGSWTGIPTPTFTRAWLRDGVPIAGATASTYVVQAADEGNGLTCKVTAKNASGSVAALSNTLIVPVPPPPPPPPPPRPVITLLTAKIVVSHGVARVPIACAVASCSGLIGLEESFKPPHPQRSSKLFPLGTSVDLIKISNFTLAAGHIATIVVYLNKKGRNALAVARHHRLVVTARVSVRGGNEVRRSVVLTEPPPKHKHGHR